MACSMPSEACMAGDRGMPCPTGALFLALIFFSLLHAAATYHSQSARDDIGDAYWGYILGVHVVVL